MADPKRNEVNAVIFGLHCIAWGRTFKQANLPSRARHDRKNLCFYTLRLSWRFKNGVDARDLMQCKLQLLC